MAAAGAHDQMISICVMLRENPLGGQLVSVDKGQPEPLADVEQKVATALGSTYPGKLIKIGKSGRSYPVNSVNHLRDFEEYVYDPQTVDTTSGSTAGAVAGAAVKQEEEEETNHNRAREESPGEGIETEDEHNLVDSEDDDDDDEDEDEEASKGRAARDNNSNGWSDEDSYSPSVASGEMGSANRAARHRRKKVPKKAAAQQQQRYLPSLVLHSTDDPKVNQKFFLKWKEDGVEYPVRVTRVDYQQRTCRVKWERFSGDYGHYRKDVQFKHLLPDTEERKQKFDAWYNKDKRDYIVESQKRRKRQKEEESKSRKRRRQKEQQHGAGNAEFCCGKYREYCFRIDRRGRPPHDKKCSRKRKQWKAQSKSRIDGVLNHHILNQTSVLLH